MGRINDRLGIELRKVRVPQLITGATALNFVYFLLQSEFPNTFVSGLLFLNCGL